MQRELKFESLDEIFAELDRFDGRRVETTGVWSFAQICDHLAWGLEWAVGKGAAFIPDDVPELSDRLRKRMFDRMKKDGRMPPNILNTAAPSERVEGDGAVSLARLKSALGEFRDFQGEWTFHPLLALENREDWELWARYHCAHHLGYARPGA